MHTKKTKAELLEELTAARQRIAALERASIPADREAIFSRMFQASPSMMALAEIESGKFVEVNEAFLRTFGFAREEVIGKTSTELSLFVDPDQRKILKERLQQQGYLRDEFILVRTKAGEIRYGLFTGEFVQMEEQQFLFTAMNDVTSHEKMRNELRETHDRLLEAQSLARLGNWEWDLQKQSLTWSEEVYRICGVSPSDFSPSAKAFEDFIHPDDRESVLRQRAALLEGSNIASINHRIILPLSGDVRHVHVRIQQIMDERGTVTRMIGTVQDVTDQKLAGESLRKSEELLSEAQRIGHIGHWEWIAPGLDLTCSDELFNVLQIPHQGNVISQLTLRAMVDSEDKPKLIEWDRQAFASRSDLNYEFRIRLTDGRIRWVHQQVKVAYDHAGQPVRMMGAIQDITERKLIEEKYKKNTELLEEAQRLGQIGHWAWNVKDNLITGSEEFFRIFDVAHVNHVVSLKTLGDSLPPSMLQALRTLDEAVFASQTNLDYEFSIQTSQGHVRWLRQHGIITYDEAGKPVRMVGTIQDITERKLASEALRLSELKYRSLYENLRDGFSEATLDGGILEYNEAFRNMVGYSDVELKKMTFLDITPERWHAIEAKVIKTQVLTRGYSDVFEKEYRRKDGSIFPVELRVQLNRDEKGRPISTWAVVRDITYRKAIENELIRINERFTELAEYVSDIFWISEPQTHKNLYVSPSFVNIMGRNAEEVEHLPNGYLDIVLPEDQPNLIHKYEQEDSGFKTNVQYRIRRPDESIRWIRDKGTPVFDGQGKVVRVVGIVSDITEQVEAAARISESEKRFQQIANTIPEMFWMFDNVQQHLIYVSPAYEQIWGRSLQDLYENNDIYLEAILPEDRNVIFMALKKQANGEESEMEYRVLQPDGSIRWVHDRSFPIFDEASGSLIRTAGVVTDVTERKRTESALRESEERLRISISAAKQGLYDLNLQTGDAIVNREYAEMLGYDPETFTETNQAWLERMHPDDLHRNANSFNEYINGVIPEYRVEFRQRTREGKWKWILSLGKIVEHDADGKPLRMLGTHTDITEQKQAELELQKRASHLALINGVGRRITALLDFQAVLDVFPRIVQETFGYHHIGLFILDKSAEQLVMSSKAGEYAGLFPQGHRIRLGEGVVGSVALSGEMKLSNRVYDDPRYLPTIIPTQAELSLPIKIGGEVIGVLDVQSPQPDTFTDEDITVLGTLVDQMAVVIENARLYEAAQKELAERKRVEEERLKLIEDLANSVKELTVLHESGRALSETLDLDSIYPLVYRSIAEVMPCDFLVISAFDPQTELITCEYLHSQEGPQDVSGFPPLPLEPPGHGTQSLVIRSGESLLLSDYDKAVSTFANKIHFNEKAEIVEILPDDEERTRSAIIVPLKVNGAVMGVLQVFDPHLNAYTSNHLHFVEALAFHVSAALSNARLFSELEERVQQRTTEVQDLYDNAPAGYHSLNAEGKLVNINQTELTWLGYTREEMLGRAFTDFITPETVHRFFAIFPLFKQQGHMNNVEVDLLRKDGTSFPVLVNATAVRNEAGDFLMSRTTVFDNTELKQAELNLREREENYRALFESANDAIFMLSPDGTVLRANPRCFDLLGYTPDELIGRTSDEFIASSEKDEAEHVLTRLLAGERLPVYDRHFIRKDGSLVETEVNLSLICDEAGSPKFIQSVVRDISARKQAESALLESEEQNRLLFEESPEAVALFDPAGRIVRTNHSFDSLTGTKNGYLIGHLLSEIGIMPRELMNAIVTARENTEENDGVATVEFKLKHTSGQLRDIYMRIFTLHIHDELNYLASMHDVTTNKRAEEALRLANAEMERALRLKDEFLANMSHELRTPLNAILGITESLLEHVAGTLNEKQMKYLNTVLESAQHLLELINDILDLAKINAGRIEIEINKTDINTVAQSSLRMIKELAQKKGLETGLTIEPSAALAWVDERRLKQMLVNLLSNAVKFTPKGGKIGLEIKTEPLANIIQFTVWDTGIGISQEDIRHLFQPFVQLDAGLARGNQGTGLGLALVSQMARLHGGNVSVESSPGQGSRFAIALPWVKVGTNSLLPPKKEQSTASEPAAEPLKPDSPVILVVDDTESITMLISDYLKLHGYRVFTARDGIEGLMRIDEVRPDLILMDVMMPELDGRETTRRIRRKPEMANIPIIALTALAMDGDRERCLDAGMNDYLSKPVKLKELLTTIQKHIQSSHGGSQ